VIINSTIIYCLIPELRDYQIGKRIKKIRQSPDQKDILIITEKANQESGILFSSHPEYYRMEILPEKELGKIKSSFFETNLFSYAEKGEIEGIQQVDFDRLIKISCFRQTELQGKGQFDLIFELTGRNSNLILVNRKNNQILDCLKRVDISQSRYRQISPGLEYLPPPPPKKRTPFEIQKAEFDKMILKDEKHTIIESLVNHFNGMDKLLANKIAFDSSLSPELNAKDLNFEQLNSLWESLRNNFSKVFNNQISPQIITDRHRIPQSISVLDLPNVPEEQKLRFNHLNSALIEFFSVKVKTEKGNVEINKLLSAVQKGLDKLGERLNQLKIDLKEAETFEQYKRFGDLLIFYQDQIIRGKEKVVLKDIYRMDCPEVEIPLNPTWSPMKNAQNYFKKYRKSKDSLGIIKERKDQTEKEILVLQKILKDLKEKRETIDLEKIQENLIQLRIVSPRRKEKGKAKKSLVKGKKEKFAPKEFITSDGLKVLVGRNNKENDYLTFHIARSYDLWFHTEGIPGSHVVLRKENKDFVPPKNSIIQAAKLAAHHSQAKQSSKVPVIFTTVKYVKKPKGARPGLVFVQKEKTIIVQPGLT
jgi:predicted ribosome quality control (RQC) complex YloA/Tae2 family protein